MASPQFYLYLYPLFYLFFLPPSPFVTTLVRTRNENENGPAPFLFLFLDQNHEQRQSWGNIYIFFIGSTTCRGLFMRGRFKTQIAEAGNNGDVFFKIKWARVARADKTVALPLSVKLRYQRMWRFYLRSSTIVGGWTQAHPNDNTSPQGLFTTLRTELQKKTPRRCCLLWLEGCRNSMAFNSLHFVVRTDYRVVFVN